MPSDVKTEGGQSIESEGKRERWRKMGRKKKGRRAGRVRGPIAGITVGTIEAISGRWDGGRGIVGAIYVIYRGLINRLMKQ